MKGSVDVDGLCLHEILFHVVGKQCIFLSRNRLVGLQPPSGEAARQPTRILPSVFVVKPRRFQKFGTKKLEIPEVLWVPKLEPNILMAKKIWPLRKPRSSFQGTEMTFTRRTFKNCCCCNHLPATKRPTGYN